MIAIVSTTISSKLAFILLLYYFSLVKDSTSIAVIEIILSGQFIVKLEEVVFKAAAKIKRD
jgi:hypothetical protein